VSPPALSVNKSNPLMPFQLCFRTRMKLPFENTWPKNRSANTFRSCMLLLRRASHKASVLQDLSRMEVKTARKAQANLRNRPDMACPLKRQL
jgi:hypothetical protein